MPLDNKESRRLGEFSPLSAKRELGLLRQVTTERRAESFDQTIPEKPEQLIGVNRELNLLKQVMAEKKKEVPIPKERGVFGELVAGFGRGALGVVAAPAEIADVAGEALGWEALEKAGEAGVKAVEQYIKESPKLRRTESISKNILKNPELWKDPRWYSSIVGEGLPTILSMLVPGMAAAKVAKVAKLGAKGVRAARIAGGLSAGVGLEAAGAASDIRHHEEQTGKEIPISTKLQSVLGTGIVAGSLEYVPIFAMFGKTGARKLISRTLSGMAIEGTTEGAQGLVANAFAKAGYDADRNMVDGVVESIVGGVMLGGGMGAVSRATNFQERVEETKPEEVSDILEQAETEVTLPVEPTLRTPEERQAAIEAEMPAIPMTTISEETTALAEKGVRPEVVEPVPEEIVPEEIPLVPKAIPAPLRAMGMRPTPIEPIVEKPAVPFMITKETETKLDDLGYTKKDIDKMTPEDALSIVEAKLIKEPEIEKPEVVEKESWEMTKGEIAAMPEMLGVSKYDMQQRKQRIIEDHYYSVRNAIKEGKPVPAEVLAEYPDLAPAKPAIPKPAEPIVKEVVKIEPSEILKPEIESKYGKFLEKVGKRLKNEAIGQDILDTLEESNILPGSVSRTFWKDTFFKLPEDAQNNIKKYLTSLTGMKPGDVMAILKGEPIKAKDWIDIANVVEDDLTKIEHLEGTERGYIALMAYANEQIKTMPAKPQPPKLPRPTLPEVVEEEIKAEPIAEVAPEIEKIETIPKKEPIKKEPGFAWIKGKQKPILSAREITKGKNKGKYEVVLTKGRDAEGNIIPGAKKIVTEKDIITMPEIEEKVVPIEKPIEEAKARIKTSTSEILKGERGSFSTETKEGAATFEDFSIVGKDFIQRGADTFTKFTEQMKKTFVDVWESVKHLAKEIYTRAKAILIEERGEITIREEVPKIEKPIEVEPKVKKQFMEEVFKILGIKPKLKPEEPLPKRARSVGLAYQNISEESKRLEVEMGLEYPKVTRTHKELREQADRIMGDQEQLIKTMEKKENFTEAEGLVVRRAAATGLESLMKVVATEDIKKANEIHKEFKEGIDKQVQDLHSEFGRNLESLKEKVSPESMAKAFSGLERDLNKEDLDKFNTAAEALGQGDAKPMINFQKHLKATKQDPKIMDYVYEYWYNSILSGIPTHVINIASNTAWGAWQIGVHKPILAAIDPLVAKFQKRPTEYYMDEIIPALAGIKRGFKPGIKGAKEVLIKGYTTDAELDKFAADMGSSVGAFSRSPNKHLRAIAPFLTMPTRALRGMDIWAKQMNYEAELGSIAKRMEKKGEGKFEELLKNPTKNMMNEASQYADYTTFMEKLGKIGTMIEKLRIAVPGGRFIVPFVRTIANLVKRGVEMTPGIGAMKLLGGKVKGKEVTQVLAKQVEGAMIALVVASMFDDDEITGDVPANKAEREAFYRQGKKPWSIKIGDRWYQYRRIEPFNTPVAAVGILYDTWKRTGEEPSTEFAYRSAAGFVNNIIDSSYLSGLTQVLDSVRKADKWPQKLTNMFDKTIASFSPMSSFQRSFVRAIEAIDKEGAILRKPKGAIETLAAATPFISEMVPARRDVWGKEIIIPGTPLEQWLPWKTAKVTKDVVENEIERLHNTGLLPYPGMPAKYMSIAGKRFDFDDDQYDMLVTESGQASKKKLDQLVGTSYWKMLSDKEKALRIQRIIKSNRKKVRNKIKRQVGVIPGVVPWKTTKKKKIPAWQKIGFKKQGWQKPMGF